MLFRKKATISPIKKPSAWKKLAPHQQCMLQKRSYHQKNCRPFEHYMLQKLPYQTAVSPPNLAIFFHSSHQKGAGGSPVLMREQTECSEYFKPAKLNLECKTLMWNWCGSYQLTNIQILVATFNFYAQETSSEKLDLRFKTHLEKNFLSYKKLMRISIVTFYAGLTHSLTSTMKV